MGQLGFSLYEYLCQSQRYIFSFIYWDVPEAFMVDSSENFQYLFLQIIQLLFASKCYDFKYQLFLLGDFISAQRGEIV